MNATNKLLDKWIEWRSTQPGKASSNTAIAKDLGVTGPSIANYRSGLSQAAPHVIEQMAREIGENPVAWLALVESERARNADDRKTWQRLARSFGAAAALALVALFPTAKASAMTVGLKAEQAQAICIMRNTGRRVRALAQRMHDALSRLTERAYVTSAMLA